MATPERDTGRVYGGHSVLVHYVRISESWTAQSTLISLIDACLHFDPKLKDKPENHRPRAKGTWTK